MFEHQGNPTAASGYMHGSYAEALAEFGRPHRLKRCGSWILERPIPGFQRRDAMGCYPLFACADWRQLHYDLDEIGESLVSLSLVTDPFGNYEVTYLEECFRDLVRPFKEHFVIDLGEPIASFVDGHHRRNAHKALRNVRVERCDDPGALADEWISLYGNLIERHNIKGIPAFSKASLAKQLAVPGVVAFRGVHESATVGMVLWYLQGDVGYYHLGAYSPAGYELLTSFAIFWTAIEYFASTGLRWLDLGAGAGLQGDANDGLSRFKRGWSNANRMAYLCGRIFDKGEYAGIVEAKRAYETNYFPAYRKGEFG